tara:strand:- start:8820 stop:9716 length:897 start_codon:yes stop_codon:yes gene_type:complete
MKKKFTRYSQVVNDLIHVGIFKSKNTSIFSNQTRDKNIKVLKDKKTGVIFIPKHRSNIKNHYQLKNENLFSIKSVFKVRRKNVKLIGLNDDVRRFEYLKNKIKNKSLLDFGCGKGKFLKIAKRNTKNIAGLEISRQFINHLSKQFKMYEDLDHVDQKFDVVTLFHVLEHIPNQIETLKKIKKVIYKNGKLFIEVPHANDLLLNLKVFRNFTLWSEHLVLHTKFSLTKYLKVAGFKINKILFIQRYNFLNHLKWFMEGKPEGHVTNQMLYDKDIIETYNKFLIKNKITDTLFVEAKLDK